MNSIHKRITFACMIACKSKVSMPDAGTAQIMLKPAACHAARPTPTAVPAPIGSAPNLLDVVPAALAVSSTVENPLDFPEHLIDGNQATAWNSRSGDLHGWIAFRVPADAHVDAIEMNAGYNRFVGSEDQFTANYRISRIALYRNGQLMKEVALDTQQRELQRI
jgi:hypothetical protein